MFVDWLDLEKGWDTYQGNKAIVKQIMVVICKALEIAIIYFTQLAKKDKNFPLLQDFIICLTLQYNLKVKVIYLV